MDTGELQQLTDQLLDKYEARRPLPQRLLDVPQAAVYMGRTLAAMQHMVKRGTVPVTRIDGKVQIDRLLLDQLIKARTE